MGGDSGGQSTPAFVTKMFQSTPPRGRRRLALTLPPISNGFQSTPPRGRRRLDPPCPVRYRTCFNPRLRVGGDTNARTIVVGLEVSIHASAWEATFLRNFFVRLILFQSTPPRGRRLYHAEKTYYVTGVSIHASAWEATTTANYRGKDKYEFQSTPPRGRRLLVLPALSNRHMFQSTPPRGRRRSAFVVALSGAEFQSTPPRGRRLPDPGSTPS